MNQAIKAADAAELIKRHTEFRNGRELTLQIVTFAPGSIGGTPTVGVEKLGAGFDWDAGKLMLHPLQPLTTFTPKDVAAIHKSAREGQSWHAYEAQKTLRARIRDLEAELAALKQGGV